ncbi:MAG: VWA domain-containing protein [Deltaproteobacteria bacterium]|nr:VWA domain-containing protein [Deltaproteobacteria bacterium]
MFAAFFYALRDAGVPVSPTSFLRLQRALGLGLIQSLDDFYAVARSLLVKSERFFDRYDQVFAHIFAGAAAPVADGVELGQAIRALLEQWLAEPAELARLLRLPVEQVQRMSADELVEYFVKTLAEQQGAHHGGNRWIGTGGTSPFGHGGVHPGGLRVGGGPGHFSAIKVALDRRYHDYEQQGVLTDQLLGEALKRLRHLKPSGPKDKIDVDATIYQTVRNGGEIELVFRQRLKDKLKVALAIDNGGWSMVPYVKLVQRLFDQARAQFKDLRCFFFHNTIYDALWEDAARCRRPYLVDDLPRLDPETRFIVVGDASMAPDELYSDWGNIYFGSRRDRPSSERLSFIARTFKHCVWLNPVPRRYWPGTHTIGEIASIFPMYELTLDGIEQAVAQLMRK